MLAVQVPTVEDNDRIAVGNIVSVPVRKKKQVRRGANPRAAEAQLDPREVRAFVPKDEAAVKMAVAVLVLEDDDSILSLLSPVGIGVAFDHPEASAVVKGERDGLTDIRLAGKERDAEARGQDHAPGGIFQ